MNGMELDAGLAQVDQRIAELLASSHAMVREYATIIGETRGKMLRPRLLLASASMFGDFDQRKAINCAACCELLHISTLIHDDVIDEADNRRGQATLNNRFGNEIAVIVGDYVMAMVIKTLSGERDFMLIDMMLSTSQELGMGVLAEIISRDDFAMTEQHYFEIIYLKTAALFSLCCAMGAYIGGASEEAIGEAREYGKQLGLGFQIVDDLLDITVDESVTGKPGFNDLREGRVTLPMIHAVDAAPESTKTLVSAFKNESGNGACLAIRKHLLSLGSLHYAYTSASTYLDQARARADVLFAMAQDRSIDAELKQIEARVLSIIPAVAVAAAK